MDKQLQGNGKAFSAGGDNVSIFWCMTKGDDGIVV